MQISRNDIEMRHWVKSVRDGKISLLKSTTYKIEHFYMLTREASPVYMSATEKTV